MALKFQKILRLNPINMQSLSGFDLPNSVNPCIQLALHLAILQFCWFFVSSFSLILPSPLAPLCCSLFVLYCYSSRRHLNWPLFLYFCLSFCILPCLFSASQRGTATTPLTLHSIQFTMHLFIPENFQSFHSNRSTRKMTRRRRMEER